MHQSVSLSISKEAQHLSYTVIKRCTHSVVTCKENVVADIKLKRAGDNIETVIRVT